MIAAFHAWTRTQPADAAYDFADTSNCAYARFLRETGREANPDAGYWGTERHPLSVEVADAIFDTFAPVKAHTFGALAERLEKLAVLA